MDLDGSECLPLDEPVHRRPTDAEIGCHLVNPVVRFLWKAHGDPPSVSSVPPSVLGLKSWLILHYEFINGNKNYLLSLIR